MPCPLEGLTPDTTYNVIATARINGVDTPVSSSAQVVTPASDAPVLTAADDTSSTTGLSTAALPPGVTYISYTFTARPVLGGQTVVVTSTTPEVDYTSTNPAGRKLSQVQLAGLLQPGTKYEVTVVATRPDGSTVPAPNAITFVTPAPG